MPGFPIDGHKCPNRGKGGSTQNRDESATALYAVKFRMTNTKKNVSSIMQ